MGNEFVIVKRAKWGAKEPKNKKLLPEVPADVIFHHTGGPSCSNKKQCIERIKQMQEKHMNEDGKDDIKFNFLIGGDARVYEGRGWKVTSEHVDPINDERTISIAFIGTYHEKLPSEKALEACRGLMYYGVRYGHLTQGFEAWPHAHLNSKTYCPGLCLLDEYFEEMALCPNPEWGKVTFIGRFWDKIRGVDIE